MSGREPLGPWRVSAVFSAFAFNYFLSALLRAVVGTLAPEFARELSWVPATWACWPVRTSSALPACSCRWDGCSTATARATSVGAAGGGGARLCGVCAGTQLRRVWCGAPADRHGRVGQPDGAADRVLAAVRSAAAAAPEFVDADVRLAGHGRVDLPVQALLPSLGWRGLFLGLAATLAASLGADRRLRATDRAPGERGCARCRRLRRIVRHPVFVRSGPLAFFTYGGLIAVQSLWAGPWLTHVVMTDAAGAAQGLFVDQPRHARLVLGLGAADAAAGARGIGPEPLIAWGWPLGAAGAAGDHRAGPRRRCAMAGRCGACCTSVSPVPAGGCAGLSEGRGRARAVGIQPGDLSGVFCLPVGHGPGHRRVDGCRLGAGAQPSRRDGAAAVRHDGRRRVVLDSPSLGRHRRLVAARG